MTFSVPIRAVNQNAREHWAARAKRVARERQTTMLCALATRANTPRLPCVVTLTRIGKRLMDSDAVPASCKAVRDEVAALLGCGDGPMDPITWRYEQERGEYAVRVTIESA